MPRKTRRRIRRSGTRRSGTRIRGGNRRYHNGGLNPVDEVLKRYRTLESNIQQNHTIRTALDRGNAALGAVAARGKAALGAVTTRGNAALGAVAATGNAALAAAKEKYSSLTNPSYKSII